MQKSPAIKQSKEVTQARHATKAFSETSETVAASPSNTMVAQQDGVVNSSSPKKSPHAISKEMVKRLGIGDYIGTRKMNNLPKSVLGYYQTKAKYIAVRSKDAGDYVTTMHEMGHAIADKIGMTGTPLSCGNRLVFQYFPIAGWVQGQ